MRKKVVIVLDVATLSAAQFETWRGRMPSMSALADNGTWRRMRPAFPALTCSMQTTLLAGKPPADHGVVGNLWFERDLMRLTAWPQEAGWARGPRIWNIMRERDPAAVVALLFLQVSRFAGAAVVVGPAPLHTDRGLVPWCYSRPPGLYESLAGDLGPFDLASFWGPAAGWNSTEWIADAALRLLDERTPDMLVAYLPHMDYVCQKEGPESAAAMEDARRLDDIVGRFAEWCGRWGNAVLFVISEYGMRAVSGAVPLNRLLRKAGFLEVRRIGDGEYLDYEQSAAFAVTDHQVAHLYCKDAAKEDVAAFVAELDGVAEVWDERRQREAEVFHPRCGDLIALSRPDRWFCYHYWENEDNLPFFARGVDIHNKPGYDPLELFLDRAAGGISLDTGLVKGSHGLVGDDARDAAVMLCSEPGLADYAPEDFAATQFLGMLYRVI